VSEDTPESLSNARRSEEQTLFDLIPVQLPAETERRFYEGFCNNLIWPLFHYFSNLAVFSPEDYDEYCKVNEKICEVLCKHLQPGDRLWIHDYHFLLLPRLVRQRFSSIPIGFFLHIPFPSYELFRLLPRAWSRNLLLGMLGADLVGFHTYDYVQHFTQCAIRMVGAQAMGSWLSTEDSSSRVEAFPIGIDAEAFAKDRFLPEVEMAGREILSAMGNRLLVFSVDRLDYTKGLLHRLLAVEKFLLTYPQWKNRMVFNMVVVPSRDTIPSYQEMKQEIEGNVGRINGLMSSLDWRPVVYQYRHLSRAEMIALYSISDVALITPLRDGMNLVAKEYVASQPPENPGVLILSEMAGASAELREALIVNPNDSDEIVEALHTALEMKGTERHAVWSKLRDRVHSYDVYAWASDFLHSLSTAAATRQGQHLTPLVDHEIHAIQSKYVTAPRRVILLDYDGTLVPFHRDPEKAVPSPQVHELLGRLCADTKNEIAIISGRDRSFLERWFSDMPLNLVAEHGASQRLAGQPWQNVWNEPNDWKKPFRHAMEMAVRRCPGSFIEEKRTSLVWHFRNADPIYGLRSAQELMENLENQLNEPGEFRILDGNHIVEVRPGEIDKGSAALRLFGKLDQPFVLAIGDDRTDEDLFSVLPPSAYAVKVGRGGSRARYHLKDPGEVVRLLEYLVAPHGAGVS
ncbi:MAG: bifunctional alpha,alpha-trehalose-phosphate synthase (UDP-forming)/trehalose-phosphatase, partial [Sphaerochaetaceae bacterium]